MSLLNTLKLFIVSIIYLIVIHDKIKSINYDNKIKKRYTKNLFCTKHNTHFDELLFSRTHFLILALILLISVNLSIIKFKGNNII